jgi:hypothetical protein
MVLLLSGELKYFEGDLLPLAERHPGDLGCEVLDWQRLP